MLPRQLQEIPDFHGLEIPYVLLPGPSVQLGGAGTEVGKAGKSGLLGRGLDLVWLTPIPSSLSQGMIPTSGTWEIPRRITRVQSL